MLTPPTAVSSQNLGGPKNQSKSNQVLIIDSLHKKRIKTKGRNSQIESEEINKIISLVQQTVLQKSSKGHKRKISNCKENKPILTPLYESNNFAATFDMIKGKTTTSKDLANC